MIPSFKRFGVAILAIAVTGFLVVDTNVRQSVFKAPERAYAGNITSPAWALSSTTESASNVTYTLTFTNATALASGDEVRFVMQQPPGPSQEQPNFNGATTSADSTAGLRSRSVSAVQEGPSRRVSITTDGAIAANTPITIKYTGVSNPSQGGITTVNVSTLRAGTALDGNPYSNDANSKMVVGTVKLSGSIRTDNNCDGDATDEGEGGLAGVRLEVHPGPGSTSFGFWQTTTDANGDYSFAGLANGTFVFEKSPGVDPGSSSAATVSQYGGFDQESVTITDSAQVKNKIVCKSQKKISGKVVRAGTGTAVKGAQVNAGSMGGGFANTNTDSSGNFEITMAATGQVFLMVQPQMQFGPPPGQGGQPTPTPASNDTDFAGINRMLSFVKPTATAETITLGNVEVPVADATVNVCIKNPDGSNASGGAGLADFKNHSFTPLMLQDGCGTAKLVAGRKIKVDSFDPQGTYSMPPTGTTFTSKKGTQTVNITKVVNDKTITITAKRIDGGTERAVANAQAMVFPLEPGPPMFATTNSDGVATVKVPTGFVGRANVMPGGSFGGGPKGADGGTPQGPPPGGPGSPQALLPYILGIEPAFAQQQESQNDDGQLFPVTGFQKVKAGESITAKFDKADKALTLKTVNPDGSLYTNGTFVSIRATGSGSGFFGGCPTAGGIGQCKVVAGNLEARVMVPPDATVIGKAKTISNLAGGETVELEVTPKNRTISGFIKDSDGAVIKSASLAVQVGAFGPGFAFGKYNPEDGSYSVAVSADKWRIGAMSDNPGAGGYVPSISPKELDTTDGNVTFDMTLAELNATITGKVTKTDGTPVEGATVTVSNTLTDVIDEGNPGGPGGPGGPGPEGPEFAEGDETDDEGNYTIPVVPGDKYTLIVNVPGENLFSTGVTQVEPKKDETVTANITLAAADMTIAVEANKTSGDLTEGKATIFSDNGLINLQADLDETGKASISVPSKDANGNAMVYHVVAGSDVPEENKKFESDEFIILGEANKTVSTTLVANEDTNLPKPASVEVSSSSAAAATLLKGTEEKVSVTIPAGAITASSSSDDSSTSSGGNSVMAVVPLDGTLPRTKTDTPIGSGVAVDITDSSGNAVTSLSGTATVRLHYTDADLASAGLTETELASKGQVKYFNESTQQYEGLSGSTVNTTLNYVEAQTTHFSDFAIVATTDTTAPAAPTSITATDVGTGGKISIAWTKPTDSDFASVKIYRSTASGVLGDSIATETGTSKEDTSLTNGTKYYYTVRSVDTAGNESTNTTQVSAIPSTSKLPKTGEMPVSPWLPLSGLSLLAAAYVANYARIRKAQ